MYNSIEEKDVLQCPYNKYHFISLLRFSRHLVKCEKNYPNDLKVICPYDATHRLDKNEIGRHIKHCPARATVEGYFYQLNDEDRNYTKVKKHKFRIENDDKILEDLDAPESSLSYALENVLSFEKDEKLFDNSQNNKSKFKPMIVIEPLSDEEEKMHDRRTTRQRMNSDHNDFPDESIISREVSMVGRRAVGRGNTSDYSSSLIDESIRGEESLVGLRAFGRGRPISSNAERLTRFRMKGGKTGGRVPKFM